MRTTVTRLQAVDVYECDGPGCTNTCDKPYAASHCGWVDVSSTLFREPDGHYLYATDNPRLYFCSWCCVAAWANQRAVAENCGVAA